MTFVEYVIITLFVASLIGAYVFHRMTKQTPIDGGPFRSASVHGPLVDMMPNLTGDEVMVRPATGEDGVELRKTIDDEVVQWMGCLLYTSPSPRDATLSRMPSSA